MIVVPVYCSVCTVVVDSYNIIKRGSTGILLLVVRGAILSRKREELTGGTIPVFRGVTAGS